MLSWDDDRFDLGQTRFRATPDGMLLRPSDVEIAEDEFFIFKPRPLVDRYVPLLDELKPDHIMELGFLHGGSTLFLAQLAEARKLVAVDRQPRKEERERIRDHAAKVGLGDVIRTFGEVDQADRPRLATLVDDAIGETPLDLVVDDCSHLYEPTRASFNELFPRLRPGGLYVIEDWRWAHSPVGAEHAEGLFPGEVPLTRLLFEIALAIPGMPGLIRDISIEFRIALITRGDAAVDDPSEFEIARCSNPRGRALLATT